ncbi:MAG: hypothetical protein HY303_20330 [Candidatus Wallbacteria bacterium]|nr:hypothetical protein [Candidatus Wallbacteria bacterium]
MANAIGEYFEAVELAQDVNAAAVVGFLDEMLAAGSTLQGIEAAWVDLEFFVAYLESYPTSRRLDELEPWEYSRFLFDFLTKEVYEPLADETARKREVLSTVVAFLGYLERQADLSGTQAAEQALSKIFRTQEPREIPRPPMRAGELLGFLNGPNTGVPHRITVSDLWLALARDAEFDGKWKQVIDYLESTPGLPGQAQKVEAVKRLASILMQDELDPIALMGETRVTQELVDRARKFFYGESA